MAVHGAARACITLGVLAFAFAARASQTVPGPDSVRPEAEPNGSAAAANVLDFGSGPAAVVRGAVPLADQDVSAVDVPAGFKVWAQTDTGGLVNPGATARDTLLDLIDSDGSSVIETDDDDGFGNGADGTLESGLASLIAGRPAGSSGTKYLRVRTFDPEAYVVDPYSLTVVRTDPALDGLEVEPNDAASSANFLFIGAPSLAVRRAAIDVPGDVDVYSFVGQAGHTVFFAADCDPERDGATDLVLELLDGNGNVLLDVDSSQGEVAAAEGARFTIPSPWLYFVRVRHFDASATGTYHLMVADASGSRIKGDFDRNQQTDLLFRRTTTGQNDVWLMNGVERAALATLADVPAGLDWSIVGADDFNGDLNDDLVLWNSATAAVEVWLMNGTTRIGAPVSIAGATAIDTSWRPSATGDFNADGRPDLVWRNVVTQKIAIWMLYGVTRIGDIVPSPDQAADENWEIVAALDYDGNGTRDFLWYNATSGKIVQWLMNASVVRTAGRFTNPASAGDSNWKVLASGDYGVGPGGVAGTTDVVWRNATSGNLVVWHLDTAGNRTAGTFTSPSAPSPVPTEWTIVGPR